MVVPIINTAFSLSAKQTPGDVEIKSNSKNKDETRVDFYLQCLKDVAKQLPGKIKYCVADGVLSISLHLISKLRKDADLRFLYTGPQNKRGRPKKYDDKINFNNLSRFEFTGDVDDSIDLYTALVYSISLKCVLRIAVLVKKKREKAFIPMPSYFLMI